MTRTAAVFRMRPAHSIVLALQLGTLPLIAIACGDNKPRVTSMDSAAVAPVSTLENPPTTGLTRVSATRPESPVEVKVTSRDFGTPAEAYKAGEYHTASDLYKVKLASAPDDAFGQYMLGLSSWKSGDFAGALLALEKSITLDPKLAKAYFNSARVLLDLKRAPEALEMIEKGRAVDSTSLDVWRLTARAKAESGDIEGAIDTYKMLLKNNETDAWGLNNYGMLLFNRGDVQESLEPLARAVQVKPTAPLFLNNLGMALEKSGYAKVALRHYELAVQHDSTFVKSVRNAERLKATGIDLAQPDEVDVGVLAETFRVKVKSW